MLFSKATVVASALISSAIAKNIPIKVGFNNTLTFSPNTTTADVGDILDFTFYAKNHSVVQGPFGTPCSVNGSTDLAFSGFIPTSGDGPNSQTFSVNVTVATPLWFYCAQTTGTHCAKGMVMVVNEVASSGKTLDVYAANAAKVAVANVTIPAGGKAQIGSIAGTSNFTAASSTSSGAPSATSSATNSSSTSKSAANTEYSPFNMLAAGAAAFGALAFSIAL